MNFYLADSFVNAVCVCYNFINTKPKNVKMTFRSSKVITNGVYR